MGKVLIVVLAAIFGLASPAHAEQKSTKSYYGDCLNGSKVTSTIVRTNRIYQEQDFFCNQVFVYFTETQDIQLLFLEGSQSVYMRGKLDRKTNQMSVYFTSVAGLSGSISSEGVCLFSYTENELSKIQCGSNSNMWNKGTNTETVVLFDVAQE